MKNLFIHGTIAGVLAAGAALVYNSIYSEALLVDFSKVLTTTGIISSCIFGCLLASVAYFIFSRLVKYKPDVWFNLLALLLTFSSFSFLFSIELPMEIESPELFIGLTIPMHLFPLLFWLATKSLFSKEVKLVN